MVDTARLSALPPTKVPIFSPRPSQGSNNTADITCDHRNDQAACKSEKIPFKLTQIQRGSNIITVVNGNIISISPGSLAPL